MSFILALTRDKPYGLFMMDDGVSFQDYSSYDQEGYISGDDPSYISAGLVSGATHAPVLTNLSVAKFQADPVFSQEHEGEEFTLSCWARVVEADGEQQLLGNFGLMNGLTINGTIVSFVTQYTTTGESRASFDLQEHRAFSAWGVHTKTKNSLFINGVLVAEAAISIEQQADSYATPTTTSLSSGVTEGSGKVAVNAVSYYPYALGQQAIARQDAVGRDLPQPQDVVPSFDGDYIPLSLDGMDIFLDQWISTADGWRSGVFDNTAIVGNMLVPTFDNTGTSFSGRWNKSIALDTANSDTIYGVQFNWDGIGASVSVSLNGADWETVERGVNCSTIPEGTLTSEQVLQISIAFPGGIVDDPAYVDNLNIVGLRTGESAQLSGRVASYTYATPERDYPFVEYHENYGAQIEDGGTITVSEDLLGGSVTRTIELLIKRSGDNPTVSLTGDNYINGVPGSSDLPDGQWVLWHIVLASDSTSNIVINGPCQVGYCGVYNYALTTDQIATAYSRYTGTDVLNINDSGVIGVTQSSDAADLYKYDWAIVSSG